MFINAEDLAISENCNYLEPCTSKAMLKSSPRKDAHVFDSKLSERFCERNVISV